MKSASASLIAHIDGATTTMNTAVLVTRRDGQSVAFTDADKKVTLDGHDYQPTVGHTPTGIESSGDLAVDNLEVIALIDDHRVTREDLLAGRYDYASVVISEYNRKDTAAGTIDQRSGTLGQISVGTKDFRVELRGAMQPLQQSVGRHRLKRCDAELGDSRCKVRLAPPTWAALSPYTARPARDAGLGSVVKPTVFNDRHFYCSTAGTSGAAEPSWNTTTGGTTNDGSAVWTAIEALTVFATVVSVSGNNRTMVVSAIDRTDGWFDGGRLTFSSGANAGIAMEVKRWTNSGDEMQLFFPMPFAISPGDAFSVTAGCALTRSACRDKFDNILNARGFFDLPTRDVVMEYPDYPT